MDQPLTVVLPMHNCERQLRSSVIDILDLTFTTSEMFQIVVVDDGSTDDTYETACELARQYPQLTVLRQPFRQGLGAALDLVRNRMDVQAVIVHDGISVIDVAQLQNMLQTGCVGESSGIACAPPSESKILSNGSRRFAAVRALHNQMEQAHRSTMSCFQWMQLEKPLVPRRCQPACPSKSQPDEMLALGAPIEPSNIVPVMNTMPQG